MIAVQSGLGRLQRNLDRALGEIEGLKSAARSAAQTSAADTLAAANTETETETPDRKTANEVPPPAAESEKAEPAEAGAFRSLEDIINPGT